MGFFWVNRYDELKCSKLYVPYRHPVDPMGEDDRKRVKARRVWSIENSWVAVLSVGRWPPRLVSVVCCLRICSRFG